jgi:hypothetical protein
MEPLPDNFVPGSKTVVVGKGKRYFYHSGNVWLRELAASMLHEYDAAVSKLDKSLIISDVVELVRKYGAFVKRVASGKRPSGPVTFMP